MSIPSRSPCAKPARAIAGETMKVAKDIVGFIRKG
jgi:hypothetical protein